VQLSLNFINDDVQENRKPPISAFFSLWLCGEEFSSDQG